MCSNQSYQKTKCYLELESGEIFNGYSFGAEVSISGEVVFQTGMVGYPESLTDPSYRKQILVLTYPLIGNYGIPEPSKDKYGLWNYFESEKVHISGLVVSEYNNEYSHWNGTKSLGEWLKEFNIPGISGIDTRQLTKIIREKGAVAGRIIIGDLISEDISPLPSPPEFIDIDNYNLVDEISVKTPIIYNLSLL